MCNSCNTCGCGGYDPLLAALTNLFAPLGCGCYNRNNGSLVLVNNLGTVQTRGGCGCQGNNGCGCGRNNNGCGCQGNGNNNYGFNPTSGFSGGTGFGGCGCWQNNNGCGCGCQGNNGCGCGNTYDAYYVRQYALNSCCNN